MINGYLGLAYKTGGSIERRGEKQANPSAYGKKTSEGPANGRQSTGQNCKWSLNHGIKKHLSFVPEQPFIHPYISDHSVEKKRQMLGAWAVTAGATLWETGPPAPSSINVLQCFLADKHNEFA